MKANGAVSPEKVASGAAFALILAATFAWGAAAAQDSQPEADLRVRGDAFGARTVRLLAFQLGRLHSRDAVFAHSDLPIEKGRLDFFQRKCDIGVFHRPMTPEQVEEAKNAGMVPKERKIGFVVFAVAVHPANPTDDLSLSQLRALYSGDINNWRELGGPDTPVLVVARSPVSDYYKLFVNLVMGGRDVREDIVRVGPVDGPRVIVQKNPNAIAHMHFGLLDRSLKALSVDGIPPTPQKIRSGDYPLASPIFLCIDEKSERIKEVEEFIDLILSKKGRELLERQSILPLKPEPAHKDLIDNADSKTPATGKNPAWACIVLELVNEANNDKMASIADTYLRMGWRKPSSMEGMILKTFGVTATLSDLVQRYGFPDKVEDRNSTGQNGNDETRKHHHYGPVVLETKDGDDNILTLVAPVDWWNAESKGIRSRAKAEMKQQTP